MMWMKSPKEISDIVSLIRDAKEFALLKGLIMRSAQMINNDCVVHTPFTLFPSPFPRSLYQYCLDIQPIVNKLMVKIANDNVFMDMSLSSITKVDDFTRNLVHINGVVNKEGLSQPIISCIDRSDYMLDRCNLPGQHPLRVRQVEVNAIASSLSSQSYSTHQMHKYLMSKYRMASGLGTMAFADNDGLKLIAQALIDAFDSYGKVDSYILVVIEDVSLNFSDHLSIELKVVEQRPDIRFVRRRFRDLVELSNLKLGPNKELFIENVKEVALVYFRHCYDPEHYNFTSAWDVRLLLERSRAIKCPSINFHLAGAKKFQQVINNQNELEKFLDIDEASKLAQVYCKFWSIEAGTSNGEEGFQVGLTSPKNMVLKPQREGGGHNIYGDDIKPFLNGITCLEDRSQYILMEYIQSPKEKNWILFNDESCDMTHHDQLVSELGIFGSILAEGSNIKSNEAAGYLVRSKRSGVNEGGVAAGYAGISSVMLFDDQVDTGFFYDNS